MRPALTAQLALTTAAAALLSSFAALYVAQQAMDARAGVVLRALLVTVALVVGSWAAVRPRVLGATRAGLRLRALLGLALGYALSPTTWQGRTYAAQLVVAPGTATVLLDLALWLVVGGAVVMVASAPAAAGERATYAVG
ncbi:hypothetical protein [Cellulomonas wangsupingiae]|uniref:Uncharacterized protein n=1 Tax=Cellulomonas wangsupingiae TaxID=2968085 RepID=A0ABY5K2T2_9CELL|nr:hypothetical protein [Cellulomonas wangsupingiae]MCC2335879.1 hypothetical protein [Cellulomonas wangsupingiae]MCM0639832.1 hypothetical protein [Cellulomonas wangsupingiae]UUI64104.1 hypothetical protein NP075_13325 [Cellulomonas wangsupingiae]